MSIKSKIRTIENYPIEGVMFRDITTLLKDPEGLRDSINKLVDRYKDLHIDKIVAIEARGFIIGAPSSISFKCGSCIDKKTWKVAF